MKKIILSTVIAFYLIGCKQAERVEVVTEDVADYSESNSINPEVEGKVFKSNAAVKMQVSDAFKIGSEIEDNAVINKGFILSNQFYTQVLDSENVKVSDQTLKMMDKIEKHNTVVLKVPVNNLRSHLKFSLDKGLIINSIEIENEELTFQKNENDLQLSENDKLKASEKVQEKVTKAILADNIKYASISYELTQAPSIITYEAERTDLDIYQELNLALELKSALKDGVYAFKKILIFIVQLLPTILAIGVVVLLFKYAKKIFKNYRNNKTV
ncbi:hypothetical protein [Faecalibacter macacae]|uniref:DUF4349 domain-containing protein n=1 Tax=Faecalibacter macacae TaxID=1859289 RepID=A0A3L9MHM1_9FLAO|nr:hypothetical protein [Faecalibacter macacae]RLZ12195.1 hypothetical protein EAH69_01330 [Faecalibacter macacae]